MQDNDIYLFADRDEWRAWLEKNHKTATDIWLGYYKKHTGKKSVTYNEAVEVVNYAKENIKPGF